MPFTTNVHRLRYLVKHGGCHMLIRCPMSASATSDRIAELLLWVIKARKRVVLEKEAVQPEPFCSQASLLLAPCHTHALLVCVSDPGALSVGQHVQ